MSQIVKSKSEIRIGFFELLFGVTEGCVCIATSDPKAPKTQFVQKFFNWPSESLHLENYILKIEASRNVYFCINLLNKMERKKSNCLPTDLVWADLDTADPDEIAVPPAILIQSSPGRWQAIWRLKAKIDPYDAERYSKRVAYAVGADKSGWDLGQLLRVPLTRNFKYESAPPIALERALETKANAKLFETAFDPPPEESPITDIEIPDTLDKAEDIIAKYSTKLDLDRLLTLYSYEPAEDEDWSKLLWSLEVTCFRAGMEAEEVFIVARDSGCNKYKRDGRPVEHLWRDVLKAGEAYGDMPSDKELLEMPQFVGEPASETFIDIYKEWACEATDAIPEFHELSAFIVLSAITSSSLRLRTSYGDITPNLWGLVLGDSTVTRKSTSMKMAVDLLVTLEPELILATDGSVEGLLSGMATRPNKVSVFFRDEVSGLFDSINRRDYLSSMPETLAHLYDVPPVYSRLLRKEVIRIESPAFIFFGGGITERVYANISESWIESGFMPRFLVVSGEFDIDAARPTGPPTEMGVSKRTSIVQALADVYENYATEVATHIGGQKVMMPPRVIAELTEEAWARYQAIELKMTAEGLRSLLKNAVLPTFDRMSKSMLKMAMILAAVRQTPIDNKIEVTEDDIINAAWYVQKWGRHSVQLILNAGKAPKEKGIERVYDKIANNPGILRSRIMQHLHLTKRDMDEIIQTLEERGQIRKEKAGKGWRYFVI